MYCTSCGKKTEEKNTFCIYCGEKIKTSKHSENISEDIAEEGDFDELLRQAVKKQGIKKVLIGIVWIIAGLVITAITYAMADDGGSYYVFWGLCLVGIIQIFGAMKFVLFPQKVVDIIKKKEADKIQ